MVNIFGPMRTAIELRDAVQATIKMFGPDYLAEVGARHGRPRSELPMFNSFPSAVDVNKMPEEQLPSCLVVIPGILDTPENRSGKYQVRWSLGIASVVSGQTVDGTYELCVLYATAMRVLILQHPSLGGIAKGVNWVDESYNPLDSTDMRTIAASVVQFGVDLRDVVDTSQGPTAPSLDSTVEPSEQPSIQAVYVDVGSEE